jgi:hypothetical protein
MKIPALLLVIVPSSAFRFVQMTRRQTSAVAPLRMVLEKPVSKKLAKIEVLKIESDHLIHPLKEVSTKVSILSLRCAIAK